MKRDFLKHINIKDEEVLRYLEYKGQIIDDNLKETINQCKNITKARINPRYTFRVYSIKKNKGIIEFEGSNLKLESRDLYKVLKDCNKCILMAATIGLDIEKDIRKYSFTELTKGIIIDSCATTAIEEVCDMVQEEVQNNILEDGQYTTLRYSPGYGDLPIEKNKDILNLINGQKEIGLTITTNGIMIPRKSVIAIIGISDNKLSQVKKSCKNCNNKDTCKFKRGVDSCESYRIYKG
ncbi:Vitamin B12 dependent methionine synthase, activation domain protein [Romboutsia sp. CE17]|uniref:vitamin B12 dependent-methionine synthase activation domain-containing protein n=1 Tax=Romboutsia sp. CE17 TaxID=2724150 RepID=UPI001442AB6D|nr:vitamin B12 dependent-methionine synthase activation domain-containing protein [Romboutsia sp. CE17]QJA09756.1 Vitamin B12 dependent methionine synthase, activation domain protein [Romboutsia sp. CE17]